jgi:acetyltransferase-like isoleucine patch superfamily enzyme
VNYKALKIDQENPNDLILTVVSFYVDNGDYCKLGDPLMDVEGQKAVIEVLSPEAGYFYGLKSLNEDFDVTDDVYILSESPLKDFESLKLNFDTQSNVERAVDASWLTDISDTDASVEPHDDKNAFQKNTRQIPVVQGSLRVAFIGGGRAFTQCVDIIEQTQMFKVAGYFDQYQRIAQPHLWMGDIDFDLICSLFEKSAFDSIFVSIGDNSLRKNIMQEINSRSPSIPFVSLIHPQAYVSNTAFIGQNVYIGPFVHVGPKAYIQTGGVISAHCNIEHHCHLENFVLFGPGVQLSGGVRVDELSVLSAGVSVESHVHIGSGVFITSGKGINRHLKNKTRLIE